MNILLINQFFWPSGAATSQLLTDVARDLHKRGHNVTVICGSSRYGDTLNSPPPPVRIERIREFAFSRSAVFRLASYLSFGAGALFSGMRGPRPDVVVTLTTPPFLSVVGWVLKMARGSRHFIWEMDLYPEILSDLGYLGESHPGMKILKALASQVRQSSDGVIVLGTCMKQRLLRESLEERSIYVAENWSDGRAIQSEPLPDGDALRILYSGNLGLAHDLETIRGTLLSLQSDTAFAFEFGGGGTLRRELESFCNQHAMTNVVFRGYCPNSDLSQVLGTCHIGLITQSARCLGDVVPSKLYTLMAAGRPILFIGPKQSTVTQVIEQYNCGWQIDCGDVQQTVQLLRFLSTRRDLIQSAGARSRRVFEEHYDSKSGVARIRNILEISKLAAEVGVS